MQLRVGFFLTLGLAALAATVVYFGRLGDGLRSYYPVRVEYPNASGLLQGASVLLAGAKVGLVESPPIILPDMDGVYVNLKIYDDVEIPSNAEFSIQSSGLLGDKFVVIKPQEVAAAPIEPGAVINGTVESDLFGMLADNVEGVQAELKAAIASINSIAKKVDSQILTESTISDLKQTMENLQETSASFSQASGKIEEVLAEAKEATAEVKKVISRSDTTLTATNETLGSIKKAAETFDKALGDIRSLIRDVRRGKGPIGTLLSDEAMAANMKAFVENLRERGILWYRNRPPKDE